MASFIGCQKEKETSGEINEKKIEVHDGILSFATVKDYENTIDYLAELGDDNFSDWEEKLSFVSMRATFDEATLAKKGIEDVLLATLLNPEGLIQIAGNIYKLDIPNEVVYAVPASDYVKGFYTKKGVRTFDVDSDILDIVAGGITDGEKGKYCPSAKEGPKYWYPNGFTIKYKVVYQKAGFYYSLQAKIKRIGGADFNTFLIGLGTDDGSNFWRNRKSKGDENFSCSKQGYDRTYNCRPYHKGRRLTSYRFGVNFWGYDDYSGSGNGWADHLIISCP